MQPCNDQSAGRAGQLRQVERILEALPAAVALYGGRELVIEFANPAYLALARGQAVLGRPVFEVFPEAEVRFRPVLEGVLSRREMRREDDLPFQVERWPGGPVDTVFYTVLHAPLQMPGARDGVIAVAMETTAQVLARRQMEEFVSVVAHDLKSPLTTILGFGSFLAQFEHVPEEQRAISNIVTATRRLGRMIDDLLDVSRLGIRRLELDRRPLDLGTWMREAVERQRKVISDHVVTLSVSRDVPRVMADPDRLEQVLGNLLSNAAKYSPAGTEILVAVEGGRGEAVIAVRDQGEGIDPGDIPQLFQRFFRSRRSQNVKRQGLGVGLYICRGLIEAHGGRIWVESRVGGGSTFRLSLPAAEGEVDLASGS